jgi:hypothetical protein
VELCIEATQDSDVILFLQIIYFLSMNRYSQPSYGQLAKGGFLLGVAMLLVGAAGELAISAHLLTLPAWEETLFFDLEVLGIVFFLFSPFVFGIFLPLVDG